MGGLYGPGRWHKKGNLVIYTSEHASLAAWEKLVHVSSFENLPDNLSLVKIEIPDEIEIQSVPQSILVSGWKSFPFISETLDFGTSFLRKMNIWLSKYLLLLFRRVQYHFKPASSRHTGLQGRLNNSFRVR